MSHRVYTTDMLHDMEQTMDDDDEGAYGLLQTVHMDYLMERKTVDERDNGILLAVNTVEILHSMEQRTDNHYDDDDDDGRDCGMLQTVDMAKAVTILDHETDKNDEDEITDTLEPAHMMNQTTTDEDNSTNRPVVMVDLLKQTMQAKNSGEEEEEEGRIERLSKSLPSPSSSWKLFDEPGTPPQVAAIANLPPPMAPKKSSKNRVIPLGKQRPRKLIFGDSESSDLPQEPMDTLQEDRSSGIQAHSRLLLNEGAHADLQRPDAMQEDRSLGKKCNRRHLFGEDIHQAEPSDVGQVHMDLQVDRSLDQVHLDLQEDRSLSKRHQCSLLFGEDERDEPSADLHQNPLNLHRTRPLDLHERPFGLQETRPLVGKQRHRSLLFGEDEQQDEPSDIQQGPKETRKSSSSPSSSSSSVRVMQLR